MYYEYEEKNGEGVLVLDVPGYDKEDVAVKKVSGWLVVTAGKSTNRFKLGRFTVVKNASVSKGQLKVTFGVDPEAVEEVKVT